jgi:hypothetical protein
MRVEALAMHTGSVGQAPQDRCQLIMLLLLLLLALNFHRHVHPPWRQILRFLVALV